MIKLPDLHVVKILISFRHRCVYNTDHLPVPAGGFHKSVKTIYNYQLDQFLQCIRGLSDVMLSYSKLQLDEI
jgi:hypothetical protein